MLSIGRGTLLTPSGNFQIFSAARLKSNIRHLGVFRKDNATNAPNPQGVDAWTRAIGERLGYSSTELRKNLEKVAGMKDRMCDPSWRLLLRVLMQPR